MKATVDQIIRDFQALPSWEDRYRKIISMGSQLPMMAENLKTDGNKVRGCQSQVWLVAEVREGKIYFVADSDASIVKGLVALLLKVYSGRTPQDILSFAPDFIQHLGLNTNLSQTRANGLVALIKQIKFYALGFQTLLRT